MNQPPIENKPFSDPLENFDPKVFDDPVEQAIAEMKVVEVQHQPHATISPDATINEAAKQLATQHVACLLVVSDEGKLVGVFTDREVLRKVALDEAALTRNVSEVMTTEPICVKEDDSVAAALCVMAVHGFRHVPILDYDDRVLGIVSPQRATAFLRSAMTRVQA